MSAVGLDELITVHEARMRLKREASKALPQYAYRDPAQFVEFPAEVERKKKIKQQKRLKQGRE